MGRAFRAFRSRRVRIAVNAVFVTIALGAAVVTVMHFIPSGWPLAHANPGNDTATTEIYTLSLHDVPISVVAVSLDRKSVGEGKRVDFGGRRTIKKKRRRQLLGRLHGLRFSDEDARSHLVQPLA